jgi:Tfp pilus assembly protein PilE
MVRNIVIVLILAVIAVPSWQIGTIKIQKNSIKQLLEEQANSIKKYEVDFVKDRLKGKLQEMKLPTEFKLDSKEQWKIKITYNYTAAASVFGHTYYQANEQIVAETEEGSFDAGKSSKPQQ